MSQAMHLDACKHGYTPGGCPDTDCRNSARAKALYAVASEPEDEDERHEARLFELASPIRMRALRIAALVASEYDLPLHDVLGRRRFQELVESRMVIFWLCREVGGWSYPSIGRALDRDHTTIRAAFEKIDLERRIKRRLQARLDSLVAAAKSFEVGS